jgi:hypothetical protein
LLQKKVSATAPYGLYWSKEIYIRTIVRKFRIWIEKIFKEERTFANSNFPKKILFIGSLILPSQLNRSTYLEFLKTHIGDLLHEVPLYVRMNMWFILNGASPCSRNAVKNTWLGVLKTSGSVEQDLCVGLFDPQI